eukprot:m.441855 g.441855  ORF g.441855 m.441855 type:complete len:126 (-) comp128493_c0_seq1:8-385(-)
MTMCRSLARCDIVWMIDDPWCIVCLVLVVYCGVIDVSWCRLTVAIVVSFVCLLVWVLPSCLLSSDLVVLGIGHVVTTSASSRSITAPATVDVWALSRLLVSRWAFEFLEPLNCKASKLKSTMEFG